MSDHDWIEVARRVVPPQGGPPGRLLRHSVTNAYAVERGDERLPVTHDWGMRREIASRVGRATSARKRASSAANLAGWRARRQAKDGTRGDHDDQPGSTSVEKPALSRAECHTGRNRAVCPVRPSGGR